MKIQICIILYVIACVNTDVIKTCTFQKLYQSEEERFVVYQGLSELFKERFSKVIKEAQHSSPYLVDPAKYFEKLIKHKYINEGYKLESLEDLELVLKGFNYIKFGDFREQKLKYEQRFSGKTT